MAAERRSHARADAGMKEHAEPAERWVDTRAGRLRVWEKGEGPDVAFLGGLFGCARWFPFLDELARTRRVVAPSLPGFPGGGRAHERLDDILDWITATLDVVEAAGAKGGDVIGCSVGAMLAAECAAVDSGFARRLVLVSTLGMFDADEPAVDPWAALPPELPGLLCVDPFKADAYLAAPAGVDANEWQIVRARAAEAAARLLWPLPDRGLVKRLHRVRAPTLLVWGEHDRIIPRSYAKRFTAIPTCVGTRIVEGAGHAVELDSPAELARMALEFLTPDGGR